MNGDCDFVDELLHPLSAGRSYRNELLSLSALELDVSVDLREERVVAAPTHVEAGMELRPALTYDDLSRRYELSAETLHTEALGYRIPTVLGASSTFLMCHTDLFSFCFHEVFHHNGHLIGVLSLEVPKAHKQIIRHALQVIRRVALV